MNAVKKTRFHDKNLTLCGLSHRLLQANFAPLLFLKFHSDYHISLGNIALISTFFFFAQLLVDLFCAKLRIISDIVCALLHQKYLLHWVCLDWHFYLIFYLILLLELYVVLLFMPSEAV